MDEIVTTITIPSQNGSVSNGNQWVPSYTAELHISSTMQFSSILRIQLFVKSYLFAGDSVSVF